MITFSSSSSSSYDYGHGYGDGYGYGYDDGHGYGYGDGFGYGYGNSYGDSCGSGYGDDYGDDYGHGYGDAVKFFAYCLSSFYKPKAKIAFWRSHLDGRPANGGEGESRKLGQVEEIPGPLKICTKNALHGSIDPTKWKGERLWVVALYEPVQQENDKIASLKREILADLGKVVF